MSHLRIRPVNHVFQPDRGRAMMFGAPSWSEPGARESLGPVLGGQRPNAGLGPRSSVQPTSAGGIPSSVGFPAPPATLSAADLASPPGHPVR
jgi:hypothetical protein